MKGGISLKNSDFLKILESFPGKMELQRSESMELLVLEQAYIDFDKLFQKMKKRSFQLNIPRNEEIWFKFLSFMVISMEYEEDTPITKDFLKLTSRRTAEMICDKFNQMFHGGQKVISDIGGITSTELIEFAKSGEALL